MKLAESIKQSVETRKKFLKLLLQQLKKKKQNSQSRDLYSCMWLAIATES